MAENENTFFREMDWLAIVLETDKDYYKDPYVYLFSNGMKKYCTDKTDSGVYDGS